MKLRVKFNKGEEVRFISHLNLVKTFLRALARSNLPVAYSEGFSPHPRVSFGPSLPLGMKSKSEFADIITEGEITPREFKERLNAHVVPGMEILEVEEIELRCRSLSALAEVALYEIKTPEVDAPLCISLDLQGKVKIRDAVKSLYEEKGLKDEFPDVERVGLFTRKEEKLISLMEIKN